MILTLLFSLAMASISFQEDTKSTPLELVEKWGFQTSEEKLLIKFYSPNCGGCKAIEATWNQVVEHFAKEKTVRTAELNCVMNTRACTHGYNIQTLPTLAMYQNNKEIHYTGERTAEAIIQWANSHVPEIEFVAGKNEQFYEQKAKKRLPWSTLDESPVVHVLNEKNFAESIAKDWALVFFHIGSGFDQDRIPTLVQLGEKLTNDKVAVMNVYEKDEFTTKYDLNAFPTMGLFLNGEPVELYPKQITEQNVDDIVEWVATTKVSVQQEQNPEL